MFAGASSTGSCGRRWVLLRRSSLLRLRRLLHAGHHLLPHLHTYRHLRHTCRDASADYENEQEDIERQIAMAFSPFYMLSKTLQTPAGMYLSPQLGDAAKYATIAMADNMGKGDGGGVAASMAQMAMGMQMRQQMMAGIRMKLEEGFETHERLAMTQISKAIPEDVLSE